MKSWHVLLFASQSFLMVGAHFPHIKPHLPNPPQLSPFPLHAPSKQQTAAATLHCATLTQKTVLKYFQITCSWWCNYFRLTSIPSNLNFITGTNASSTALEKKHQERKISPTDQRVTFRRQSESIWKATPPTWHSLRKLALAAASAGPMHYLYLGLGYSLTNNCYQQKKLGVEN